MPTLNREYRRLLENTVAKARAVAEDGARKVLTDQYAVHHHEPWPHMTPEDRELRKQLRANGRQLGDKRDDRLGTQETFHLVQACAYEHWHRMLFARFLAENDLLLDAEHGLAMTLDEVRELAREQGRDWLDVAAELAQRMLLAVFRPDDPVLRVSLPPETRQALESRMASLPAEIFRADDSLGWVYQFWQKDEKDRVNKSEVKIGARELPAVTQLFTEDYMVLFLLENTLGAWWTAKRRLAGLDTGLPGYEWTYLRLNEDGAPAAGGFEGWPRSARELRVLDPCMGSGHFLTFALPILARMRMVEEGLSLEAALGAVLRDNLFGLEIDPRCAQIAAFNLALAAWRLAGGHFGLPELNLACSGLGINASEGEWVELAGEDGFAREEMKRLYSLFRDAPELGSLIDPSRLEATVFSSGARQVLPLLEKALAREASDSDRHELVIAAKGVLAAARLLSSTFTLIITNVPYLGRGGQSDLVKNYCHEFHYDTRADLAASMFDRCNRFGAVGGTISLVIPQSWLFMGPYKSLRRRLLRESQWSLFARLGPRAFESISGEVVSVSLCVLTMTAPPDDHVVFSVDVSGEADPRMKANLLQIQQVKPVLQVGLRQSPDYRFSETDVNSVRLLSDYANCFKGVATGDLPRFIHQFWEVPCVLATGWEPFQGAPRETSPYGARDQILLWERGQGTLHEYVAEKLGPDDVGAWIRGAPAWNRWGVAVAQMSSLSCTLYTGELFDESTGAIIPVDPGHLSAIWAYCNSPEYAASVKRIDRSLKVPTLTLLKVPFDVDFWHDQSRLRYPKGLPAPASIDETQWLFAGRPRDNSCGLAGATLRLLGYRWPRQTGSSFPDCPALPPDGLEAHADTDGIVCLNSIGGEASASNRLRALLADAYGEEWSASKLSELLGGCESLEVWLRDQFFEEHCRIFHTRPFVWHIWDGRKDGFHVLVNYHKLAGPDGEGRKTLEKLIYTFLGDWITRQRAEVSSGAEGSDGRLSAALHLKGELEKILWGEKPYDLFVRWKPLHEQAVGWEPDLNDGVRLNLRPWLQTTLAPGTKPKKGACVLRVTPKVVYGKDRGREPQRAKEDFPWFWKWDEKAEEFAGGSEFDGARWNDLHYSLKKKLEARSRRGGVGL